jgi:erythromycin esterase-like protein
MEQRQALDDRIARGSIAFSLDSPDAAIDQLIKSLGDSIELLGFGEALHGGEEILLLRNRLFQRLVEAHGFSAIAVESSFPRGRVVNEYVTGRGGDSYEAVRETGFNHGFGRLDANRELVEWMRRYNADPAHRVKAHFYGFDMPGVTGGPSSPRQVLQIALDYLGSMCAEVSKAHRERINPLLGEDAAWEDPTAWRDPTKSPGLLANVAPLRVETEELISSLRTRQPELVAGSDRRRYLEALQHAKVARQLLTFYVALAQGSDYAASLGVRDALMADVLEFVVAAERGRGKVLAFAHNKHLQRGPAVWQLGPTVLKWWPAGAHVSESFGSAYAVIGSALGVSDDNGIRRPEAGTLEARLTAAPGPVRFIPSRTLATSAAQDLPARTGSTKNPTYFPLTPQSLTDFDALAVFDAVTYNRGGSVLQ